MSSPSPQPAQRISRVRTGCLRCRVRKKKCDEKRPVCRACERNNFVCQWPSGGPSRQRSPPLSFTRDTLSRGRSSPESSGTGAASPDRRRPNPGSIDCESAVIESIDMNLDFDTALAQIPAFDPILDIACIPRSPAWGSTGGSSFHGEKAALLEYYLHRTAESMSNGFHSTNPFITQLVPAAFTNDLILQLILAQSAAHRAAQSEEGPGGRISKSLYAKSTHRFQQCMNDYATDPETDALPLALGTLVMCYTETARGDINGALFDHLIACPPLLIHTLSKMPGGGTGPLPDFLVEYYFYTAVVSMISIDVDLGSQNIICEQLEDRVQKLVASNYSGNLCGCWLEVLLIIPKIFGLGKQLRRDGPSTDVIALYATLHREIIEWSPPVLPGSSAWLVGQLYRHAALLYLYTAIEAPKSGALDRQNILVQTTVEQALAVLSQLSLPDRMNTSMCWPLAVIGSCVFDDSQKAVIKARLETMSATIGLGNMKQTLRLLQRIWELPATEDGAGPWNISKAMQRHQIWISFA